MELTAARNLIVVVVEDHQEMAESMALSLRNSGHKVEVALSAQTALEMIEAEEADVVFLDLAMPEMDGREIAKRIRKRQLQKPPFLVAISGDRGEDDYRRSLDAGIDLHLVKPVDLQILGGFLGRFQRLVG